MPCSLDIPEQDLGQYFHRDTDLGVEMSDLFNTGIRPAVDAYLKKKSEETRNYGQYWSASSAGYCQRLVIMRRLGVPKVPELEGNAAQTRIFEAGHIFHEWMQRITKDAGLSIASEVELQDEDLMIRGHFDDLVLVERELKPGELLPVKDIKHPTEDELHPKHLILYDYKTAHSASFKFNKGRPMGHYHTMQLGTYMYMLRDFMASLRAQRKEYLANCTEARILSISKDDLRMDEKQLMWSPELESKVVDYWTTLNKYWEEKKMPPCTCLEHDGGFMGRRSAKGKIYGDYFYNDEPCSLEWAKGHADKLKGWTYAM